MQILLVCCVLAWWIFLCVSWMFLLWWFWNYCLECLKLTIPNQNMMHLSLDRQKTTFFFILGRQHLGLVDMSLTPCQSRTTEVLQLFQTNDPLNFRKNPRGPPHTNTAYTFQKVNCYNTISFISIIQTIFTVINRSILIQIMFASLIKTGMFGSHCISD